MRRTNEQVNELAFKASYSQYKDKDHPEYVTTANGFIIGYNQAMVDLESKWIPINDAPNVKSGKFIGINKGLEYPSPIIVGYNSTYSPHWTDYYTEDEAFITHYILAPKED